MATPASPWGLGSAAPHHVTSRHVTIIEPKSVHTYRPLLSYAGAGLARPEEYTRPQADVMPDDVQWIQDDVTALDPEHRIVTTGSGHRIRYRDVVICPGSRPA